jgi:hypothetical protein|tara:strand:+ start:3889 stop:4221 length:333 start_codon:yes stop_codon:yes gene_type:complete
MISLLLTACLAAASTGDRTMLQSQVRLPNATFQYRCVEDTTMNWTFVFVRAQGCALKGSNITVTTMFETDKSYHLHEVATCEYGTKLFLDKTLCKDITDITLNNILGEKQ